MNSSIQVQEKYRLDYQPPRYWIDTLDLDFQLAESETRVVAISRVRRNGQHNDPLILDGEDLVLKGLFVNGIPYAQYLLQPGQLILSDLPAEFVLTIETLLDPAANSALEGLYKSGSAFCTQCEAEGFRRITYYLDRPDVLAKFTTRITADKVRYPHLLSNGNRTGSGELPDGRHWVSWQDPFPKPCYLFALVAGDFDVLRDEFITRSKRKVALELYVDKGNLARAEHAMASLKKSMAWDEQRFGLEYDLDIYMIVAVDFFNMGAMENKGLNIFNSKFVLANPATATDTDYFDIERVIGHEYFHNWTGNRVTCRDWFQLSLKEGLTVFRDQEFSADLGSRAVHRIGNVRVMRGPQFAEDAGPMAHPIRPDVVIEMNNFYTLTVYEKGAEVIRMLHTLLGEETFQKGMRLYLDKHDGQAATCEEFVLAMEAASGRDLRQFRRWYSQSGTPLLTVRSEYVSELAQYRLQVTQFTPPTAQQQDKQPLHIPLSIALYGHDGTRLPLIRQGEPVSELLEVMAEEQTFVFDEIHQQPIVSLLQDFSAPVKLDYPYSDDELSFLLRYAQNEFARWDAGQMLVNKHIKSGVAAYLLGKPLPEPVTLLQAFAHIMADNGLDKALMAEILTIPSETALAEQFERVDIDAIHWVREELMQYLAVALEQQWQALYHAHHDTGPYSIAADAMAKRALANLALTYLARANPVSANSLVVAQYEQANNMTDLLAAMQAANVGQLPALDHLLADFEQRWHEDGLVMDNWFRLQANSPAADVLDRVTKLMAHKAFSLKNPNRVRALIGTFAGANAMAFHAKDGSGYRFLTEILEQLNSINPQVAARMITPLIQFKRLDDERIALIRSQLQQLSQLPDLSRDLAEKVNRALAQ
ncbi:MAG: aminopeptidase N [Aeromonadaceae bacterium]